MGVVWKAVDTNLGREVAIKFLSEGFAAEHERLNRFEREARTLASLNHPGIVTIHAVERTGDTPFLVMELVRGRSLDHLIPDAGMKANRLFQLAVPLSEAVAEAHRHGITHRDLKPGNILVTEDGRVKVLDFGLAKLVADTPPLSDEQATATALPATAVGTVLGTTAYMSPEQTEGRPLDGRSDVFSLGVVLYEMATGRRPFAGETAARLISSILRDDPASLGDRRPELPGDLDRVLRRCLEKDPERRFQTAQDVGNELQALAEEVRSGTTTSSVRPAPPVKSRRVGMTVAALVLVGIVAAILLLGPRLTRTTTTSPEDSVSGSNPAARTLSQLTFDAAPEQWPAWSPDGAALAYCSDDGGYSKLFLKDLDTGEIRQLTDGEQDDIQPAWAPDGRSLIFVRANTASGKLEPSEALTGEYEEGDVWSLDLESGSAARILADAFNPAFAPDGSRIAVETSWAGPRRIWTTDARGRNPKQITTADSEAIHHTRPSWSPDGKRIVYQHEEKTKFDIRVAETTSGDVVTVTDDLYLDLDPLWSPNGEFIYVSSYRGGGLNIWRIPVEPDGRPTGAPQQLTTGAGQDIQPSLAPDGSRLAFTVLLQNADLWGLPVDPDSGQATGDPEPLVVSTREDSRGAWSPDGRFLAFNSDRDGDMNIWIQTREDEATRPLTRGSGGDYQPDWSPEGNHIAFFSTRSGNADVWVADVETGELRQVTKHPALDTNPFFSPDGDTIAFQSDRDGRKGS
jgi:Tol biopolymer transport system component